MLSKLNYLNSFEGKIHDAEEYKVWLYFQQITILTDAYKSKELNRKIRKIIARFRVMVLWVVGSSFKSIETVLFQR